MHITAAIALIGGLLIGGFLVYHKLLMPTPEEIAPARVALPTPDMLRGAPVIEPPATPPPQEVAPEPKLEAPLPAEPAPEPAEAAPEAQAAPSLEPSPAEPPAAPMPEGYGRELAAARSAGFKKTAEQFYLRALAIAPEGAEALSGLAMYYLNQGKNQKAMERAEQAVKVDPKSSEGWIVLGASRSALGDGAGARKAYQECAQFEGKYMGECKRMLR
jgi:tetratricopeptide (TPR) repeat protein